MPYNKCAGCDGRLKSYRSQLKQLTGVEAYQCRKARIQRNHLACALLAWSRLKAIASQTGKTVDQIKHGMLSDYLVKQLKNPSVQMALASVLISKTWGIHESTVCRVVRKVEGL